MPSQQKSLFLNHPSSWELQNIGVSFISISYLSEACISTVILKPLTAMIAAINTTRISSKIQKNGLNSCVKTVLLWVRFQSLPSADVVADLCALDFSSLPVLLYDKSLLLVDVLLKGMLSCLRSSAALKWMQNKITNALCCMMFHSSSLFNKHNDGAVKLRNNQ